MTARRLFLGIAVALAVLSSAASAAADPLYVEFARGEPLNVRLKTPSTVTTDGGMTVRLPEGAHIVGEPEWTSLDVELRRLQEIETRLTAENDSLRQSARLPSWKAPVGVGVAVGLVVGILVGRYAFH